MAPWVGRQGVRAQPRIIVVLLVVIGVGLVAYGAFLIVRAQTSETVTGTVETTPECRRTGTGANRRTRCTAVVSAGDDEARIRVTQGTVAGDRVPVLVDPMTRDIVSGGSRTSNTIGGSVGILMGLLFGAIGVLGERSRRRAASQPAPSVSPRPPPHA